ncbi:MAG: glycosyltransferase family 39 protein [Chloroflexota bacterium]
MKLKKFSFVIDQPYLWLFGIALALRLLAAVWVRQPGFVDAYYYYQVAENWYTGHGLSESTVWNYQVSGFQPLQPPTSFTQPAFAYWMPLSTFLTASGFLLLGGVSFWAATLPFMLLAATLPPLSYWVGQLAFGREQRRYSWLMAGFVLFPGRYFLFWNAPDNFAPFALLSLLCLLATWAGLYRHDRWLIAAGVLSGLAYLSRSDGILLMVALVFSFLIRRRQKVQATEIRPRWWVLLVGLLAGLGVVMPWLLRNWATFGAALSPNSSKALYLKTYTDLFSYGLPLGPDYYFGWGFNNIFASKLNAASLNLLILSIQGLFLSAPLFLIGLIFIGKNRVYLPFLVYLVVLYLAMTLVFTELGGHGTLFHSAGGLIPYQAGAVLAGVEGLANFRRKLKLASKSRSRAILLVAGLLCVLSAGLTLFYSATSGQEWDADYNYSRNLGDWFRRRNLAESVIIVAEPLSYYYTTGQRAIGQASDGLAANLAAAKQYGAKYLVLGSQHYDALDSLYLEKRAQGLRLLEEFEGNQIYLIE